MRRWLSSLTNRIFLSSALLTVAVLAAAIAVVNIVVTSQAERDLQRQLAEAVTWVEHYRTILVGNLAEQARLIADLPKLKAAVETNHALTVQPVAADYRRQMEADVFVVMNADGGVLAAEGDVPAGLLDRLLTARTDGVTPIFWPRDDGLLQVIVVPVWIDPSAPEVLGRLAVGTVLDSTLASQIKSFTDADVAFVAADQILATTLPSGVLPDLLVWRRSTPSHVTHADISLGGEGFVSEIRSLPSAGATESATIVLRSRSAQRQLIRTLQTAFAFTGLVAILLAVALGYAVSRTITSPLDAISASVREMAATGDLTRRISLPSGPLLVDEDARMLASTLEAMTASIARFQREAAQRERLSALGRLSTVIAHEIRNPLMIIKTALRGLRRDEVPAERVRQAAADINDEVDRLNRLVNDVLDFARPLRFEYASASLADICRRAADATFVDAPDLAYQMTFDPDADAIETDVERLRQVLVNVLSNARQAVHTPGAVAATTSASTKIVRFRGAADVREGGADVHVATCALEGDRIRIVVRDRGAGVADDDRSRIFEPYFTTHRTGSGLGLAITRNIVEGLGGTITFESEVGLGTEFHIDLPRVRPTGHSPVQA
ncbi:MAG: ATP-binding protein [Vicinamibacterales bacterium]